MATQPIGDERSVVTLPRQFPPMPAVARILARHDREQLAAFIAVAIDLLDVLDGDPDAEPNGDEVDGSFAEDDEAARFAIVQDGPGCIASDLDTAIDDANCDDPWQDLEPVERCIPRYGIDQSKAPM